MEKTGYPSIDRTHLKGIPEEILHPEIFPLSMLATFTKVNEGHLTEPALEEGGRIYTKLDIMNGALASARALLMSGLNASDKIALLLPNCREGVLLMLGANAVGIRIAVLNPDALAEQMLSDLELHEPNMIFCTQKVYAHRYDTLKKVSGKLVVVDYREDSFVDADGDYMGLRAFMSPREPKKAFTPEMVQKEIEAHACCDDDEVMLYLQTTGSSTGRPKTLCFTNKSIFAALIYASNSTGTATRDVTVEKVLCIVHYRFAYGWMTMFVNIMGGNCVALAPGMEASDIAEYYKFNASYIYGTPQIFQEYMRTLPRNADISKLVAFFCAGFSMNESLYQEGMKFLEDRGSDAEIRNNYGIGETLCIGTASDGVPHRPGTCGKFYVGPTFLIVDEAGNEVKYGQTGELIVAAASLTKGYYKQPEDTAKAFFERDGQTFFRTGDYVVLYENGYVSFKGRKKRFFFPIGATDKVNLETVEQKINSSPLVKRSAVVAVPAKPSGKMAKAFVVLEDGVLPSRRTEDLLHDFLSSILLSFWIPQVFEFVDDLPTLGSGKVDYSKLEGMELE